MSRRSEGPVATAQRHTGTAVPRKPRVLFLNRSYWPDGEATGQLLTELAEDLSPRFEVTVVAGLPNANPSGEPCRVFGAEMRNGVRILRVPHTRLPKGWLPGRALNFVTFVLLATLRATFCRRQDVVVVETDPFLLAFAGIALRLRHRGRLCVYLQDIHPGVGVAVGRLRESWLTRLLTRSLSAVYRRADRVVVLSADMRRTLLSQGIPSSLVSRIPNWVDTRLIRPSTGRNAFRSRVGIGDETFLVMYSGNLGMTQQLDRVLEAAERLRTRSDIRFAFVGGGTAEPSLKATAADRNLANVQFHGYQPRENLGDSLSAADLHLITVHPAALDYLMPSKLYGILAAGRPVLAAVPRGSELADEIVQHEVGYVVPPGDAEALAGAIALAADRRGELAACGERARRLAETSYDRGLLTERFGDLIAEVLVSARPASERMAAA